MVVLEAIWKRIGVTKDQKTTDAAAAAALETAKTVNRWTSPAFDKKDIRLVVFRDHDAKGKLLLFDSKAFLPLPQTQNVGKKRNVTANIQDEKRPSGMDSTGKPLSKSKQQRQLSDINTLGEMMFGSVAMSYKGSTLKVHSIRTPSQLMVTKVFLPTLHRESTGEQESFDNYSIQSTSSEGTAPKHINSLDKSGFSIAHSVPVDVPSPPKKETDIEELLENEDSGISASVASNSSSFTTYHSPGSSSASINSNSFNSLQRRFMRSKTKSLEYNLKSRLSEEPHGEPAPASKRVPRFGIGIIVSLSEEDEESTKHFQQFFFSHITLIESHIQKLRMSTEKALTSTRNQAIFNNLIVDALNVFRDSVYDLYTAPRLAEPVWLNMMCYSTHRVALCQQFLREFMSLIDKFDTKNTKFFLSTLITGVLTHHLAWVPTVTPAGATPSRSYMDKHSAKWLDTLAKSHPYNPLWAQLGDMYGAIGFPLRLSRTVVTGKKVDVIHKFLYVLSYFIRCTEVVENTEIRDIFDREDDWEDGCPEMVPILEQSDSCDTELSRDSMLESSYETSRSGHAVDLESSTSSGGVFGSMSTCGTYQSDCTVLEEQCMKVQYTKHARTAGDGGNAKTCTCGGKTGTLDQSGMSTEDLRSTKFCSQCNQGNTLLKDNTRKSGRPGIRPLLLFRTLDHSRTETEQDGSLDGGEPEETDADGNVERIDSGCLCDSLESSLEETTPSASGTQSDLAHQLSPHLVEESPKRQQVRNVGRLSLLDNTDSLAIKPDHLGVPMKARVLEPTDTIKGSDHEDKLCDLHRSDSSSSDKSQVSVTESRARLQTLTSQVSNGSQASDTTLTGEPAVSPGTCDSERNTDQAIQDELIHDSGVFLSAESTPSVAPSSQPSDNVSSLAPAKISFSRSSSMFDEYVDDDTIEVLPQNVQAVPKTTVGIREAPPRHALYKRMASIEGNNGIFDEYMEEPCPDVDELRKLAIGNSTVNQGQTRPSYFRLPSQEGSLSMFNEYFTEDQDQDNSLQGLATEQTSQESSSTSIKKRPDTLHFRSRTGSGASLLNRQNSNQSTGRCRSITPTELGRRRHLSTASVESIDPFLNLNEIPMPGSQSREEPESLIQYSRNFGRSLLAGYSDHYLPDFVLHGTSDSSLLPKLHTDLSSSVQNSVLDESIAEAACIVADTDKWTVRLLSCQYHTADRLNSQELTASQLVCNMVEAVHHLAKNKMSPEFCLMHLEDQLQEIYFKSKMLSEYLRSHKKMNTAELAGLLGFDESGLPLLLAVAGTHSAHLAMGLI